MDDLIRLLDVLNGTLKVLNDAKEGSFTSETRQLIYTHINEASERVLAIQGVKKGPRVGKYNPTAVAEKLAGE